MRCLYRIKKKKRVKPKTRTSCFSPETDKKPRAKKTGAF